MRRFTIGLLLGSIIGMAAAMIVGPSLIHWWYSPPQGAGGFSCDGPVGWAVSRFLYLQLGLASVGAIVGASLGLALRRRVVVAPTPATPASGS